MLERARIYATDMDDEVLGAARAGAFPLEQAAGLHAQLPRARAGREAFSDYYTVDGDAAVFDPQLLRARGLRPAQPRHRPVVQRVPPDRLPQRADLLRPRRCRTRCTSCSTRAWCAAACSALGPQGDAAARRDRGRATSRSSAPRRSTGGGRDWLRPRRHRRLLGRPAGRSGDVLAALPRGLPRADPRRPAPRRGRRATCWRELLDRACAADRARGRGQGADRRPARVHVAPPGYHLLVEPRPLRAVDRRPVRFSRPSIDVAASRPRPTRYGDRRGRRSCSPAPTTTAPPAWPRSAAAAGSRSCRTPRRAERPADAARPPSPPARPRRSAARASAGDRARLLVGAAPPGAAERCADATEPSCWSTTGRRTSSRCEAVLEPLHCRAGAPPRPARRRCGSCSTRTSPSILLDVQMPGMDGFETAALDQGPRAHARHPDHLRHRDQQGAPSRLPRLLGRRGRLRLQAVRPGDPALEGRGVPRAATPRRGAARSEALLRATFDSAPIGMARLDSTGRDRRGQPRAARALLGRPASDLRGRPLDDARPPRGRGCDAGRRAELLSRRARPLRRSRCGCSARRRTADAVRCLSLSVAPTADGEPDALVVQVQDLARAPARRRPSASSSSASRRRGREAERGLAAAARDPAHQRRGARRRCRSTSCCAELLRRIDRGLAVDTAAIVLCEEDDGA